MYILEYVSIENICTLLFSIHKETLLHINIAPSTSKNMELGSFS